METEYTHYGWFYFVPILYADIPPDGCAMEMRWTGWGWPIMAMAAIHAFISIISGVESDWPIRIDGEIKTNESRGK